MSWRARLSVSLNELRIVYCAKSASSAGTREFVKSNYADLKAFNPGLPIYVRPAEGVEPHVAARYERGVYEVRPTAGMSESQVLGVVEQLEAAAPTINSKSYSLENRLGELSIPEISFSVLDGVMPRYLHMLVQTLTALARWAVFQMVMNMLTSSRSLIFAFKLSKDTTTFSGHNAFLKSNPRKFGLPKSLVPYRAFIPGSHATTVVFSHNIFLMALKRRRHLRALRERAWWIGTDTVLKIATVAVVIAIFIIEDLDVDLSDNVSVQEKSKEKLIQQSRDESSQSNDPVQVYGAGLNAGERQADCPQCKEQIAGYDEDQQVHLNLTEFHEHAEQRAMQAALRKRAAKQKSLSSDHAPGKHPNASSSVVPYSDPQSVISRGGISKTSGGAFKGIHTTPENAHLFQFENITYLSFMLYRLIKTHDIKSVVDVPCTQSILWLPDLLQRLEFEIPHFHYRCIVPNDDYLVDAVLRFKDLSSTTVVKDTTFWTAILPKADLAVSWYGVGYVIPRISWQLLKSVRQSQTKYIIVPNHPKVKSNPSSETKHGRVNVRKPPYLFDEPFRVVKNLSVLAGSPKELMMYKVDAVRKGVI